MSARLRLLLVQADFPVGDVAGNARRVAAWIARARDEVQADVVVFPELTISGYPAEDLLHRPAFLAECKTALHSLAACTRGIVAVVGWPQVAGSSVYNAASVLREGAVETTYRKRDLPNFAVFDEKRYFAVDPRQQPCVFEIGGVRLGLMICQDLWGSRPMAETAAAGAEVVLVPNASPFEREKHGERDALLAQRVRESGLAIAYVNLVGGQDAVVFDGASLLADGNGRIHPAAEAFVEHALVADFEGATRSFQRVHWPAELDEGSDSSAWRALVLATRDYCVKNGFSTVWLGLSGGLDSAVTLAIAVDALGADKVSAVTLPSRYTADLSSTLASEQCQALGVNLRSVPIEAPFRGLLDALAEPFQGHPVDSAEENLQARARGALLMALSNKLGGLLLTTGNKSEYAVGYTTIYGDMCGGFAPLKDLYKTEVYALARWRNAMAGAPVIPWGVIERPPSAELRQGQTDQDALPPYDVLDAILRRHVDQEQSSRDIVAAGFDRAVVDRVLELVRTSEWKRQQAAPGPKVSRRAFGRERRYPITNKYRERSE